MSPPVPARVLRCPRTPALVSPLAVLLLVAMPPPLISAAVAAPAARVVSLSGTGEARPAPAARWDAVALEQGLEGGTDVRTLDYSSLALLLADSTQLRMNANAQLRLRDSTAGRSRLELAIGRLWARARKGADIELQTPAAQAVVRGTDWDVEVGAGGETTLTVLTGRIQVSNDFGSVDVGPAEQAYVAPGQAPVKRTLIRPRERVQWVMANPIDADRYAEFRAGAAAGSPPHGRVRDAILAGRLGHAHTLLQAMAASDGGDPAAALLLADFALFVGDFAGARERLEQLWARHRDPRAAARLSEVLSAAEAMGEAGELLAAAQAQAPQAAALALAAGHWHRLQGQAGAALQAYRQALAAAGGDLWMQAAAHHGLGRAEMERGDLKRARRQLTAAVAQQPAAAVHVGELALLETQANRFDLAAAHYAEALALQGDDFVSLGGAGLLALLRGDAEKARQTLLAALVIEPRFARAQLWLAVAEFQLGHRAAALDALDRASLADPNDPLPWQVRAIILNDDGAPEAAIAAAREALRRLPFLKSLDALANDSQGSANLGKALGDFGLEHWARAYAHESSHPLWAGSHFFQSDRAESDYSRSSSLFMGYLTDPTAFGAAERRPTILPRPGANGSLSARHERSSDHHKSAAQISQRQLVVEPFPIAWQLRYSNVLLEPRDADRVDAYRTHGPSYDLGLGLRPRHDVGLFLTHRHDSSRTRWNRDALGPDFTIEHPATQMSDRTDAGLSYRWSADQLTAVKWHRASSRAKLDLNHPQWGLQRSRDHLDEKGWFVRHVALLGDHRLGFGWETVDREADNRFGDQSFANQRDNQERYTMPWLAAEWRQDAWSVFAEAYWPRLRFSQRDTAIVPATGEVIFDPQTHSHRSAGQVLPRAGVAYRFGPGSSLQWAYIESLRAPGTHTLAPVALGNIPVDHQYHLVGSHARKHALQFNLELSPRTFVSAGLQRQTITNPVGPDGRLLASAMGFLFDNVATLGPSPVSSQTTLATYEETPYFGRGRIRQASTSIDHILSPRWSVLASYTYTDSENLEPALAGNRLPGFPRHLLLSQATRYHGARWFTLLRLTWRSARFRDEGNQLRRPASWSATIAHTRDSEDRNWNYGFALQNVFKRDERTVPTLWLQRRW